MSANISRVYRKADRAISAVRLKTGLYHKSALPEYDFAFLQGKWPYVDPGCVKNDYPRPAVGGVDVSICVPMYNVEAYIENLLNAIDRQNTVFRFEVILVDDGSKDKTAEIVSRFIDNKKNFHLIRQENGGISVARNTAIDHARGEYLCFIDSDDLISEDCIQSLMSAARENDADIVKGEYCKMSGGITKPMGQSTGYFWGGVYRSSLFDRVRFPVGYWYEDMIHLFLIVPQSKKTVTIEKVIYYYNDTQGSASKLQSGNRNYKSLEQLYLVMSLTNDYKKLRIDDHAYLSERLSVECSGLMTERTQGLDEPTRMQVFLACNKLFTEEDVDPKQFSGFRRVCVDAIRNKDYDAWKLAAKLC